MGKQFDPLTVALTGQLSIVLIAAAIFALVVSLLILWRYRSAVIKSMRRRSHSQILAPTGPTPADEPHRPPDGALIIDFATATAKTNLLYRSARRRPWLAALIYAVAGACFAATMTTAFLVSTKMALLPWRFFI